MTDTIRLEDVRRLDVQEGDVVVLHAAEPLTAEAAATIREQFAGILGGAVKVAVLGPGMTLETLRDGTRGGDSFDTPPDHPVASPARTETRTGEGARAHALEGADDVAWPVDDPYDLDAWRALGFEFGDGLEVTAPAGYDGPMPPADRATCRACDGTYPESAWGFDGTTPPVGRAARSCPGCGEWAVLL